MKRTTHTRRLAAGVAAALVIASCGSAAAEPAGEAAAVEAPKTTETGGAATTLPVVDPAIAAQCRALEVEVTAREEAGTLIEEEYEELSDEEYDSLDFGWPLAPGNMANERPVFDDFAPKLNVAGLADRELLDGTDTCWELGILR